MKHKLFLFIFLLIHFFSSAQTNPDFQWIRSGGSHISRNETVKQIATDSQNNIYFITEVGYQDFKINGVTIPTPQSVSNFTDAFIISYTCDGTYRWHKMIGGTSVEYLDSISVDEQDNIYVTGYKINCTAYYHDTTFIGDEYQFNDSLNACTYQFLIKFSSNGDLIYVVTPQDLTDFRNRIEHPTSINMEIQDNIIYWYIAVPPDTSYINNTFVHYDTSARKQLYVLKYNLDGTFISHVKLGNFSYSTYFESRIKRNPNTGNYYFLFNKPERDHTDSLIIDNNTINNSAAVICFDPNGNFLWHKEASEPNATNRGGLVCLQEIVFDQSNNAYLMGFLPVGGLAGFFDVSNPTSYQVDFVMKVNDSFTQKFWHATSFYGGGYTVSKGLKYHQPTNSVFVTSTSWGVNYYFGNQQLYIADYNQGHDVILAQFDAQNGNCLLLKNITSNIGSSNDEGHSLAIDSNNDVIIGGQFSRRLFDMHGNFVENSSLSDFFIAKFALQACANLDTEQHININSKIYPNPFIDTVLLNDYLNYKKLDVFDILGKHIKSFTNPNKQITLNDLDKGIYLFKITDVYNNVNVFKMVKN